MSGIICPKKRSIIIIVIVIFLGSLAFLLTTRPVRAMIKMAHSTYVLYRVQNELMMKTPAGCYYRALIWQSNDELIRLHYLYPENDVALFNALDGYIPALEALVDGKGDSVTINADEIDALQAELDWLVTVCNDDFRQVIERESRRFPLQTFIGMTARQAWDYINTTWQPLTEEELRLSEYSASEPPTPDPDAVKMEHIDYQYIAIDYPAGWSVMTGGSGADQGVLALDFNSDQSEGSVKLRAWALPIEQKASLDPANSQPVEEGYGVQWQEDLVVGALHGVRYVWGKPYGSGATMLYARLYDEPRQIAIEMATEIKDPAGLKVFGYRYTLGAAYAYFGCMVASLKILDMPIATPEPTMTPEDMTATVETTQIPEDATSTPEPDTTPEKILPAEQSTLMPEGRTATFEDILTETSQS
jgi:hypothetical protein